ncbi:pyridoxamine 5'-phosphate oxidase [Geofilum sp. OHC36d9]|uniref:pyridoxamine 5'-phosphate oxidase n=1 Tax=Geofilum sp. OHC36d9 TaxID=3458413 RepID=UPI004033D4DA
MEKKLSDIRTDFIKGGLERDDLSPDPLTQIQQWVEQAVSARVDEPTAMLLSTVDQQGIPDARVVLLKGIEDGLIFYTNYESVKGQQLAQNANVSVVFFWPQLERQIRLRGVAEKLLPAASDVYFASRPRESQLGAWASPQSSSIESYEWLEKNYFFYVDRFQQTDAIPRPPYWGGYRVTPLSVEFWQGRPGRMHQRYRYARNEAEAWQINVLAP